MTSTSPMSHEVIVESIISNSDNGDIARNQQQRWRHQNIRECKSEATASRKSSCTLPFGPSIPTAKTTRTTTQSIHNSSKSPLYITVLSFLLILFCLPPPLPIVAATENTSHHHPM